MRCWEEAVCEAPGDFLLPSRILAWIRPSSHGRVGYGHPGVPGLGHPKAFDGATPFRLLGDDCRQRALASVCGKQARVIMTFLCIGKVCLDFCVNKRPHICCRSCPQANLKSLLRVGGCWSCRRRVLVFYIRQRRKGDTVFVQPQPQKWANYFGWSF